MLSGDIRTSRKEVSVSHLIRMRSSFSLSVTLIPKPDKRASQNSTHQQANKAHSNGREPTMSSSQAFRFNSIVCIGSRGFHIECMDASAWRVQSLSWTVVIPWVKLIASKIIAFVTVCRRVFLTWVLSSRTPCLCRWVPQTLSVLRRLVRGTTPCALQFHTSAVQSPCAPAARHSLGATAYWKNRALQKLWMTASFFSANNVNISNG